MMPMHEEDDSELQAKLIAELEQLARGGQARDMAGRLGKLPPEAPPDPGADPMAEGSPDEEAGESPDEEALEQEPIPGVEGDDETAGATGKPDPSKLRMLLAAMKSKSSMG